MLILVPLPPVYLATWIYSSYSRGKAEKNLILEAGVFFPCSPPFLFGLEYYAIVLISHSVEAITGMSYSDSPT